MTLATGDDASVVAGATVDQHDIRGRCFAGSHPHQEHPGGNAGKLGKVILHVQFYNAI